MVHCNVIGVPHGQAIGPARPAIVPLHVACGALHKGLLRDPIERVLKLEHTGTNQRLLVGDERRIIFQHFGQDFDGVGVAMGDWVVIEAYRNFLLI